jgi:hypothetical protein
MGQESRGITAMPRRVRGTDVGRLPPGRGRPPKFGRPAQVVALTLPHDVLESLRAVHRDIGWAIVRLVESNLDDGAAKRLPGPNLPAELVHLPGKRALIVVQPQVFRALRGVSTIPLADGRAFLALDHGGGLADLEIAILDALEARPRHRRQRAQLMLARDVVRAWRRDHALTFRTKSIIVVEAAGHVERQPLAPLHDARAAPDTAADRRRRNRRRT